MLQSLLFASFAISSLASGIQSRAETLDIKAQAFSNFLKQFNLKYSEEELPKRKEIFFAEFDRINKHNSQKKGWTESLNKFSAMTLEEKKASLGRNKKVAKQHGHKLKSSHELPSNFVLKPVSELPQSVDWRTKGVCSAVKDQGRCGSCWAFASTAVMESHVAIASGKLFDLSTEQIAMCAPNSDDCGGTGACQGSTAELAFDYATNSDGIVQEYQYGYTSYYGQNSACDVPMTRRVAAIDGYTHLPTNNYTALMNAVATVGPIAVNVDASTWHAYNGGIFSGCDTTTSDINHVVVLVGYGQCEKTGQKYWLIRNSWSAGWGEAGYIKILRSDNDDQNCATDYTPQDGVACNGQTEPIPVCGTCGVIYDGSYPNNAKAL